MLDTVRKVATAAQGDSLLLSAADCRAAQARRRLLEEARSRARQCMAQAQAEAEQLRDAAYREGYLAGVLRAGDQLAQALLLEQGMVTRVRRDAIEHLAALLDELMLSEGLAPALLQRWLADIEPQPQQPLQLLLPEYCKASHAALRQRQGGDIAAQVHIDYHAQQRLVFRLGDHVLELDMPPVREQMTRELIGRLKALDAATAQLDAAAQEALRRWAQGFLQQELEAR
jgi:hypothetical protein